ncbi:acyl-CoA dehydrogenase family protein [Salinispora mooreana]|uniref:hypothetical protein n=1 Tax=Salinispora mooreana TaxID=999545 RepID=UPI00036ACF4A|nr:hypothetical protein [Salinispora mooreana]
MQEIIFECPRPNTNRYPTTDENRQDLEANPSLGTPLTQPVGSAERGHHAHLHDGVARTGPGSRELSTFLVEADQPSVHLTRTNPSSGLHRFSSGEIAFNNCRIPVTNRLGAEGDGFDFTPSSSFLYDRPNLAAVARHPHRGVHASAGWIPSH